MFLFSAISRPWFTERHRARAKLYEICYSSRCHSGPRDFQRCWPSNGVSLWKRGLTLLQSTDQSLENCSFLFDSQALIATLHHIASMTWTALPCAPRSHLGFGNRDDRTSPNPSAAVAVLQSPATSRWRFQFECRKRTPVKLIRFRFICEKTSLGERKQKKKKEKNAGWFFARGGGGSFATFELCCVHHWWLIRKLNNFGSRGYQIESRHVRLFIL